MCDRGCNVVGVEKDKIQAKHCHLLMSALEKSCECTEDELAKGITPRTKLRKWCAQFGDGYCGLQEMKDAEKAAALKEAEAKEAAAAEKQPEPEQEEKCVVCGEEKSSAKPLAACGKCGHQLHQAKECSKKVTIDDIALVVCRKGECAKAEA